MTILQYSQPPPAEYPQVVISQNAYIDIVTYVGEQLSRSTCLLNHVTVPVSHSLLDGRVVRNIRGYKDIIYPMHM